MEMCDWEQLRRRENKMAANEITRQKREVEADYLCGGNWRQVLRQSSHFRLSTTSTGVFNDKVVVIRLPNEGDCDTRLFDFVKLWRIPQWFVVYEKSILNGKF